MDVACLPCPLSDDPLLVFGYLHEAIMLGSLEGVGMASKNDDDLEHELQHNLKLRRKLGAEAGKGEAAISGKQRGIAYRLGWVLYWICLVLALLPAFIPIQVLLDELGFSASGFPRHFALVGALAALLLFGLGRAFRYILSGE
jgi:hypothetical protein